jgi:hypothetical protein
MQLQACAGVQRGSFLAGTLLAEHERKLGLLRVQLGAPAPARHKRHGRETAPPLGGRVRGAARRGAAAAAAARAPAGSSSAENRKKNMHPPWHAPPPLRPISCQRPP